MASITPVTVGEKRGISSLLDESVVSDSSCNSFTDGDLLCDESKEETAVSTKGGPILIPVSDWYR